ncbi:MAG: chromate transporter [Rhizobiales bacterium]|nr:chromate transporter [Hyphomicrobiales bacterium]
MQPDQPSSERIIPLGELFVGFMLIGLLGFGGIAASANYVIVERNRWMTQKEFVELFGISSVLPGGNILNASVMVGDRHHGILGSAVCLFSLLLMPLIILLIIAITYDHFSYLPDVQAGIAGGASAVAGLIIGTGLKMARSVDRTVAAAIFGLATFLAIGIFRLPLASVVLTIVPLSVATALYMLRRNQSGRRP